MARRIDREDNQGESEYRDNRLCHRRARSPDYNKADSYDRFPCFAGRLQTLKLPHKFKPANHSKYDGKVEPRQWLRVYSQSIELAGGDDDLKALYFPMALEAMPLQWFDKLRPRSIRYWEDLQEAFCNNFAGIITHPMTAAELKSIKQRKGETLRDYYRRFGEFRAQIHDITDREVIETFAKGIFATWQFKDYYNEDPRTNEDFKRAVEKLISSEERTRHRFSRNFQENNNRPDYRQQDKRPRQDNMVATTDAKRR